MKINPVFRKELKLGVRTVRLPVIMLIYNTVLALISLAVFYSILESARWQGNISYATVLMLYMVMVVIEGVLLAFIVPAITASSISGERERQTLDLLLATRMTPWGIILGKLASSISMVILLIISSMPVMALIFVFGGVSLGDVVMVVAYLIFAAVFFGMLGIFCSARLKRTTAATVAAYGVVAGVCVGTFLIVFIIGFILGYQGNDENAVIGMVSYLLMINPGVTTAAILGTQLSSSTVLLGWFHDTLRLPEFVSQHWIGLSIIVQLFVGLLFMWRAASSLKPAKK